MLKERWVGRGQPAARVSERGVGHEESPQWGPPGRAALARGNCCHLPPPPWAGSPGVALTPALVLTPRCPAGVLWCLRDHRWGSALQRGWRSPGSTPGLLSTDAWEPSPGRPAWTRPGRQPPAGTEAIWWRGASRAALGLLPPVGLRRGTGPRAVERGAPCPLPLLQEHRGQRRQLGGPSLNRGREQLSKGSRVLRA